MEKERGRGFSYAVDGKSKILSFYLCENLFGLDITAVKEINRNIEYTLVPDAPSHIIGLLNMRGQIVTLFNLARLMGYEQENKRRSTCIILKNKADNPDYVGFLIDRPGSVIDVDEDICESPPANMGSLENKFLSEVVKLKDELLLIINWKAIIEVLGKKTERQSHYYRKEDLVVRRIQELKGMRILVVEDSRINQKMIREILEGSGIVVETADNGLEAVRKVNETAIPYDAVLMDVQMPEMDGCEATRVIRGNADYANLPIIAMTADDMDETREACLAAGMNSYITKQFNINQLFDVLTRGSKAGTMIKTEGNTAWRGLPERLPGLDAESALKRLGGNKRLYIKLLLDFMRENKMVCSEIRHHLEKTDLNQARQLAHRLKGVAGNIGAKKVFEAAKNLEISVKQERKEQFASLLNILENSLASLFEFIAGLEANQRQQLPDLVEKTAPFDHADLAPLLANLFELLKNNNMGASRQLALVRQHLKGFDRNIMDSLEDAINKLDFRHALSLLESIVQALKITL
ncbi:response regulator [Pelotomaculum sp. PtaB.Bin117]|uniref:response regulator n=1 Tax=Pelotomaculum sp. PtaB.Bin117 TaxID=1811694 RepID=UPI0009D52973|nr:response regulator [Pelotomaculum sp. PtaB.Bin117]OPX88727.1 MAG: Chemotaxis protein CheV [Pelotomaculum sp. PtaB.Bin117]